MAMTQSFSRCPPPSTFLPSPAVASPCSPSSSSWSPSRHGPHRRRAPAATSSLHLGPEDVAELARNKVAIGQLSKPFTSGRDGGGLDIIKTAVRSGGMPSTHSAVVVAVTTSLGLERGFADSIFGMSVVFAAIVMYDAQGVRREVGKHARLLNKLWTLKELRAQDLEDSTSELHSSNSEIAAELVSIPEDASTSQSSNTTPFSRHNAATNSSRSNALGSSEPELAELKEEYNRLNESVGHTEAQVAVGALLGFVVSLAVHGTL